MMSFVDANGNALAYGKLCTYAAGTSNAQATYTDATGGAQNTNPVILDSGGRASVWLSETESYKDRGSDGWDRRHLLDGCHRVDRRRSVSVRDRGQWRGGTGERGSARNQRAGPTDRSEHGVRSLGGRDDDRHSDHHRSVSGHLGQCLQQYRDGAWRGYERQEPALGTSVSVPGAPKSAGPTPPATGSLRVPPASGVRSPAAGGAPAPLSPQGGAQ